MRFTVNDSENLGGEIDLGRLYSESGGKELFETRFRAFIESVDSKKSVFEYDGSLLRFKSEQIIPTKRDSRPPLLLLLGNPASHSVEEGMFFSYEREGREHRFWKGIQKPAGILDLVMNDEIEPTQRNRIRRERLLKLDYESPFRIGLAVYFSIPSGSSGVWSGVAGLRKLFGSAALRRIEDCEKERTRGLCERFLDGSGAIVTFQKDSWNGLKWSQAPDYGIEHAKVGRLVGKTWWSGNYQLFGVPPTRLSGPCRIVLEKLLGSYAMKPTP